VKPSEASALAAIEAALTRAARYDDESVVSEAWIRQRYGRGAFPGYAESRKAAVTTAWHEAGHAVAALGVGASFSSASIYHGRDNSGRVHGIRGSDDLGFVIDAAGQIAEGLRNWTLPGRDDELRVWLAAWRDDGGDARHFRQAIRHRFGDDEIGAWRYSERLLTPLRLNIRHVARALLIHPRHLPYEVVAALANVG
jgi:hypothetical protein